MSAISDLTELLEDGEVVEAIVFGPWGWEAAPLDDDEWKAGFGEPSSTPVPFDKRGVVLTLNEAMPLMEEWSFRGGFGAPACYATYVWTNHRVF